MPDDVTAQTRNCFKTIEAALKDGGFAIADIVRANYYITDVADADKVFAVSANGSATFGRRGDAGRGRRPLQAGNESRNRSDGEAPHLRSAKKSTKL